jgi:WD40 repeat protein
VNLHWVSVLRRLFFATVLAAANVASVAQVASAPLLRVDTGAHSAPLRAMDVDARGRFAVTASEDKTARVWDLASGRLLQTLRPPIGADSNGRLFAASITPDGEVVAVGGWSSDNDVYLFDRASGTMVQRITGLPNTITHLSFSPNGHMLTIGLWGKNGVRLFGSSTSSSSTGWRAAQELGSDAQYDGEVYGGQFSPDGKRYASTSVDGQVRLYDVSGKLLKLLISERPVSSESRLGSQPFGLAFAPDGRWLAVGYADTAAVAVLHADTLKFAYAPAVAAKTEGSLNAVTWSSDGRELLAAGTWKRTDGLHGLKRWANGGRGAATEVSLSGDSVVALRALADGRVAYAAADPAWGWLPAVGASVGVPGTGIQTVRSGLIDFRGNRDLFRLAANGSAVAFNANSGKTSPSPLGFDLRNAAWTAPLPDWTATKTSRPGLALTDWLDGTAPKFNGRPLPLTDNETATAAAVAPSGSGFILGTSFYLRSYKPDGSLAWRVSTPAATWQVNLSSDGRWVVAGFGDGTIRWFRARDGVEAVALLPHADQKRWVAWTPQGYYVASPGGEDLFGWQINRGASTAADFFPGSRLRANFFRPDVITALLDTGDLEAALRITSQSVLPPTSPQSSPQLSAPEFDSKTPPVLTVLSPRDGGSFSTREVVLSISVRTPAGAPPSSLRARLNGSNFELPLAYANQWTTGRNLVVDVAQSTPPPGTQQARYEQRVALPAQDVELMLFADNRNGFSTPAVLRLKWTGATAAPVAGSVPAVTSAADAVEAALRPALYVLAVGISKYQNANIQLQFASKDASDFANVFKLQDKQLYRKVEVKLLTDTSAKRDDILDGLEWIRREMTSRDVGVVFMAGHGVNDSDGIYYYLPQDTDPDKLKRTGVIFTEIRNTLAALPGKALFFVDTCHSGNVLGTGRRSVANDLTAVVNELSSAENGVIVFAASTGRQVAQESPEWGNGAFTKAVIEGMSGKADVGRTGRVTHKMLDLYVSERVKALTRGTQSPVTIVPQGISDFPVAISR